MIFFLKIAAVALVTALGFAIGSRSHEPAAPPSVRSSQSSTGKVEAGSIGQPGANAEGKMPPSKAVLRTLRYEQRIATCDLAEFPALMDAETESSQLTNRFWRTMKIWNTRDQDGLIRWLLARPNEFPSGAVGGSFTLVRTSLISRLSREDPVEAWKVAVRLKVDDHEKWGILEKALERDPALALELAEAHPDVIIDDPSFRSHGKIDGVHPMQMLPVIEALLPGGGRNNLVDQASQYFATHLDEFGSAAEWFQKLPPDSQRFLVNKIEQDGFPSEDAEPTLREIWKLPEE